MAEGKKKIIVYADWLATFEALKDDEAGRLIKHFFRYVNDMNPTSDRLTELVFTPIKQTLKRDLEKYESIVERNRENGKKGGRKKPKKPSGLSGNPKNPNKADSDSDSDSDSVSTKVDVNNFLSWFNKMKAEHTGVEGKFRTLTKTDEKNLKQLRKNYNIEDFTNAVSKLFQNQWANETGNQTPAHFLRVDNFNRYLNQSHTEPTKKKFNPYG